MKKCSLRIIVLSLTVVFVMSAMSIPVNYAAADSAKTLRIHLMYPQNTNTPKRQAVKIEKPAVLKGEVGINIDGAAAEQLNDPASYVEYYLDNELIYTGKMGAVEFVLDTGRYTNGEHTIVANLWDSRQPSAIGIRKIIIKNEPGNKNDN